MWAGPREEARGDIDDRTQTPASLWSKNINKLVTYRYPVSSGVCGDLERTGHRKQQPLDTEDIYSSLGMREHDVNFSMWHLDLSRFPEAHRFLLDVVAHLGGVSEILVTLDDCFILQRRHNNP